MTPPNFSRRGLLTALAVAGVTSIAGCSMDRGDSAGTTPDGKSYTIDTLLVNFTGAMPQFVNNFNPASPAEGIVGTSFFYDPLLWADRVNQNTLKPWLAKEWKFDRAARTMTLTLRDDLTWSDGTPITADDLIYTFHGYPEQGKKQEANFTEYDFTATKTGDLSIEVTWPADKEDIEGDRTVGAIRPKPKHIFEKENLATWTNPSPVSSSPWVFDRFTPQQVTVTAREGHFMGAIPHVKKVAWTAVGSPDIMQAMMMQGKMDWTSGSLQDATKNWIPQHEGNNYYVVSANNAESFIFNCGRLPFSDVAVRKAIYAAIDTDKMHSLYDIGLPSVSPTGLSSSGWGDWVKPELAEPHKADIDAAKKALADGGWTVEGGNLTKDGKSYPISYKTVAEYANWAAWADSVRAQLTEALGLDVKVLKVPDAQLSAQTANGDFDFSMSWVAGGTHMSKVYADLNSKNAVPVGEEAAGNYSRVKDPELDALLAEAKAATDDAALKEVGFKLQQRVVDQCYIGPANPGASFAAVSGINWTGWPAEITPAGPVPIGTSTPETWKTMQALTPTK